MGNIQQQLNQTLRTASVAIGAVKGAGQLDAKQRLAQERETFGAERNRLIALQKQAMSKAEERKKALLEQKKLLIKHTNIGVYGPASKKINKVLAEEEDGK